MLNPAVAIPLVGLCLTTAAIVVRWFNHRERMAEIAAGQPVDADRLLRLEQAVESIAIETERIGEGQRYLTRVLSERPDRDPLRAVRPRSVDTPH